jgi:hypothetical protein
VNDEHLSKGEFMAHIGPIRDDIRELIALQRAQNGRVGEAEKKIAVLEDRASPGRVASGVSALVSAAITGLGMYFSSKQ